MTNAARHKLLLSLCALVCFLGAWSASGGAFAPMFPHALQELVIEGDAAWGSGMLLFIVAALSI